MEDLITDYINDCDESWNNFFNENYKILENISSILQNKDEYFPKNNEVFNIFSKIKLQNIKVVIIGKEPYSFLYENEPITDGMAFSMNRNINILDTDSRIPKELKIIFKGLSNLNKNYKFTSYSLDKWVDQGVFLLNSCFTVEHSKPNSHVKRNFWRPFIFKLIKTICENNPDCIFLIWGNDANFLSSYISGSCTKLITDYPSMISLDKFQGHIHMEEANKILIKKNKKPIDWST